MDYPTVKSLVEYLEQEILIDGETSTSEEATEDEEAAARELAEQLGIS